ncbi:hypothetical protein BW723_06250 [Polaribacter reichenbachii]|uniref:Secretion system C-terminal sorting domain-containing protein n=1 Tax=Polaribacter reichenbachii TaxID=996801 RepID=A0A1B8U660_9FLAO|nr:T9SS type A sorting domain-containing protein [Polaribacter reichenbachii]APZ45920.1 hypothetical protein BW723_06250 [Polaribacter reichenbachii]AUC19782.1 hypothetical protein BTO17_14270 [Polaribacter reichenbachii]OBY67365.1 hypothetical protein LPB301_03240 [Polaribacter reichenbachii]
MKKITLFLYLALISVSTIFAQSTEPFLIEAESGTLGADYDTATEGTITYVFPKTNLIDGNFPGSDDKVISYDITFPEGGNYDLYIKLYIGQLGNNDDSFFMARETGVVDANTAGDWVNINQLNEAGFTANSDIVTGDKITPEIIEQWKWVNVSTLHNTSGWSYSITPEERTVTYHIGSREDGLRIDKLVFGINGTQYTVGELEGAKTLSTSKFSALESVKVYPNPTNNQFTIDSQETSTSYKIFNILGAKVEEGKFNMGKNTYGSNLQSGTYILDMISGNKRSVKKLIKL